MIITTWESVTPLVITNWGNIAEIAAAVIAVISAGVAAFFSIKTLRESKLSQEFQRKSFDESQEFQRKSFETSQQFQLESFRASQELQLKAFIFDQQIQIANLKQQYFSELVIWAKEVVSLMSEAISLCYLDPKRLGLGEFFRMRYQAYSKLSALIDQGRWFFPNLKQDEYGHHKQAAFRGYRPGVLNALIDALDLVRQINYNDDLPNRILKDGFVEHKRVFVSEIQQILDPHVRDLEFQRITQMASVRVDDN